MKLVLFLLVLLTATSVADDLRIVMWTFKIRDRSLEVPVELTTDYGYMVLNAGTFKEPIPHYVLGDRKKGIVRHFKTKKEFMEALGKLEPGGEIAHYTCCSIPSDWGLKDEDLVYGEIEPFCRDHGLKFSEEPHMRCICPDRADSER